MFVNITKKNTTDIMHLLVEEGNTIYDKTKKS